MNYLEIQRTVKEMYYRVDPKFKYKVLKALGGETFKFCYQCGTCTATCPVARFTDVFRPNKIIHLAKLGIRNVAQSDAVWLCVNCYACTEHCPQGVKVADIMRLLKNLDVEDGHIPEFSKEFMKNIVKTGFVYSIPSSRIKKREALGLPPPPQTKLADLKKLAEIVKISELIE